MPFTEWLTESLDDGRYLISLSTCLVYKDEERLGVDFRKDRSNQAYISGKGSSSKKKIAEKRRREEH